MLVIGFLLVFVFPLSIFYVIFFFFLLFLLQLAPKTMA